MPIYITYEPIRGEDGKAAPSTGELTVSKSMDMTSTPLFYGDQSNDSFDFGDISDSIDPLPGDSADFNLLLPYTEPDLVSRGSHSGAARLSTSDALPCYRASLHSSEAPFAPDSHGASA
jgi:hypothetical protein